jgi:hypothetical protein
VVAAEVKEDHGTNSFRQANTVERASLEMDDPSDPIVNDKGVRAKMDQAWHESNPAQNQGLFGRNHWSETTHEQGGWIVKNANGDLDVQRWPAGTQENIDHTPKPANAVASFHTHPNTGRLWPQGPIGADIRLTRSLGVNGYVISKNHIYRIDAQTGKVSIVANRN